MSVDGLRLEPGFAAVPAEPSRRTLDIRFTGSGSEYFRIWAVNLLLILITLGLYLPFAKARRIRYFYANTLVDGQALSFHGDPWKMFRGFVLLAVLMGVYTFAGEFSPAAALPAFLLLCLVWPALWRAAMQFRLGNTSWRGLRLGFDGSLRDAYAAFLPVAVPTALSMLLTPDGQDPGAHGGLWFWLATLATGLLLPWSTTLIKRYQHHGYRIADERSGVQLDLGDVYVVGFQAVMLGLLLAVAAVLCAVVLGSLLSLAHTGRIDAKGNGVYFALALAGLVYLFGGSLLLTYYLARVQNLVWGNTRSASLHFRCALSGLMRLTLKNWLLIIATAGLYRPFAVIAATRLRLQAVSIEARTEPQDWVAPLAPGRSDASGDVAGDFFGIDVGL